MAFFEQSYTRGSSGEAIPNYGNPPLAPSGKAERAYPCWICGRPFRESQVVWFRGRPYGVPCRDHLDIRGILQAERSAERQPPRGSQYEQPAEIIFGG